MDVERIQKINKLALDLMKQGLATDRDDAVLQAEKVFHAKDGEYNSIRERMQMSEPQREQAAAPASSVQNSVQNQQTDLHPEKIKDILQQNSQFLVKKISEFQEQMQAMKKEMEVLRQRVSQPQSAAPQAVPKVGEMFTTPNQERPKEPQNNGSNSHPRSGNYKAEEVSIEKFFYMGNKR